MSLLIKGMDMPENCAECPCRTNTEWGDDYCQAILGEPDIEDSYSGRLDNCPLSELPTPHGRLIDADALLSRLNGIKYAANVEDWISRKPIFADGLEEEIISAPTIIEAEE